MSYCDTNQPTLSKPSFESMFWSCVTRATLLRFVFGKCSDLQFLLKRKALSGGSHSFSALFMVLEMDLLIHSLKDKMRKIWVDDLMMGFV